MAILFLGCTDVERNNVFDPGGNNYSYGGTFNDNRDGKIYKWVTVGNQTWMAENLNYNATGSRCYDNSTSNCDKYGKLYNWTTAKSACPSGWHLPTKTEWQTLTSVGASYLKSNNKWNHGGNGTDDYGFTALPGGYSYSSGYYFSDIGEGGYWWSNSEVNSDYAHYINMNNTNYTSWDYDSKSLLFSVRCVRS